MSSWWNVWICQMGRICAVPLIKHWSHTVNFYSCVLLVIWTWLWLMQVCTVTSEGWMVTWWQCSVPCRWMGMAWLLVGNLPSLVLEGVLCRLVQGCVSGINWKAAPVMMYTAQAENLALSCCLNLFPNSDWFCKTKSHQFPCVPSSAKFWVSLLPESVELSRLPEDETPGWISSRPRGLNAGKVSHVFTGEECGMLREFAAILTHP